MSNVGRDDQTVSNLGGALTLDISHTHNNRGISDTRYSRALSYTNSTIDTHQTKASTVIGGCLSTKFEGLTCRADLPFPKGFLTVSRATTKSPKNKTKNNGGTFNRSNRRKVGLDVIYHLARHICQLEGGCHDLRPSVWTTTH